MGRKLLPRTPSEEETADRSIVWSAIQTEGLRLEDIGEAVGRPKSFISEWIHHRAEITDTEVETWAEYFESDAGTFITGRFESRRKFSAEDAA